MIKILCMFSVMCCMCSCSKPQGELAELTGQVLKEDQSVKIEITPGIKVK